MSYILPKYSCKTSEAQEISCENEGREIMKFYFEIKGT